MFCYAELVVVLGLAGQRCDSEAGGWHCTGGAEKGTEGSKKVVQGRDSILMGETGDYWP